MAQQDRRDFIKKMGGLSTGLLALSGVDDTWLQELEEIQREVGQMSAYEAARFEPFWLQIQQAFRQSPHFINLENGYFSPQPLEVMQAQLENIRMINEIPSFYMRRRQAEEKQGVKRQLAQLAGCSPEEIVITRNTTESLDTIIAGLDFEAGDEAILCDQDYGSMQEAFQQRAKRHGLVLKWVDVPLHPKSDSEIVECYEKAITPKTKVMLVTQLINISGQILPVRKICDMAHTHGVEVIVDGAHAFAQLNFKIPDLNCDYFGASLHKWLCCPLGAGIMYVKKDKIAKVWPLFGDVAFPEDDIRKFEHIGTHPVSTHLTISSAIRFHQLVGPERKQARLHYLKEYWTTAVKDLDRVILNTPLSPDRSSAIANIAVEGMTPSELSTYFYDKHRIFTVAINRKAVKGVRVTPHLYTRLSDLDAFIEAIRGVAG
ncbi:MAG: aminotransferase class V-fold PLP-dependent enzyme [Saprospiraceae bacterium]|nr:aminotransferase class V-fold PLP-dependent enzyme [Saprospiraceae bacterium]